MRERERECACQWRRKEKKVRAVMVMGSEVRCFSLINDRVCVRE